MKDKPFDQSIILIHLPIMCYSIVLRYSTSNPRARELVGRSIAVAVAVAARASTHEQDARRILVPC
eukprot:COSAG06_NODE_5043_length_3765_cov_7.691489_1_plen_65_part_10